MAIFKNQHNVHNVTLQVYTETDDYIFNHSKKVHAVKYAPNYIVCTP